MSVREKVTALEQKRQAGLGGKRVTAAITEI